LEQGEQEELLVTTLVLPVLQQPLQVLLAEAAEAAAALQTVKTVMAVPHQTVPLELRGRRPLVAQLTLGRGFIKPARLWVVSLLLRVWLLPQLIQRGLPEPCTVAVGTVPRRRTAEHLAQAELVVEVT